MDIPINAHRPGFSHGGTGHLGFQSQEFEQVFQEEKVAVNLPGVGQQGTQQPLALAEGLVKEGQISQGGQPLDGLPDHPAQGRAQRQEGDTPGSQFRKSLISSELNALGTKPGAQGLKRSFEMVAQRKQAQLGGRLVPRYQPIVIARPALVSRVLDPPLVKAQGVTGHHEQGRQRADQQ